MPKENLLCRQQEVKAEKNSALHHDGMVMADWTKALVACTWRQGDEVNN